MDKCIQTAGYNGARMVVKILVHSNFDLVSRLLALEATEPLSEPVTKMAVEQKNIHFSTSKYISVKATFFFM